MIKRGLFLILLVLNLLLFAWGYQRPLPAPPVLPPLPPGTPTIQLLSESIPPTPTDAPAQATVGAVAVQPGAGLATLAEPQPTPEQASSQADGIKRGAADGAPSPLPATTGRHCVRLGPLDQQKAAVDLTTALEKAGHQSELETEAAHQPSGFWVLIAVQERQIRTLMANLQAAGILDVWRFGKGPLAGNVSLGLYSDWARAEERRLALIGKGFAAEIRPREIEVATYWVRTRYAEDDPDANSALAQAYSRYPSLSFPPRPCRSGA